MNRTIQYNISEQYNGMTIWQYLKQHGYSHHILTHLKKTEMGICIANIPVYLNHILSAGEQLTVFLKEDVSSLNITPIDLPLSVIYEDDDILVVNKPSNMPIHPSMNNHDNTLANAAAYYFKSRSLPFVFRCPNRLDRDTSGLTILAKNMLSSSILSDMIKKRTLKREYLAIVEGFTDLSGTINAPISRKESSTIERIVDYEHGEQAITHYTRLAETSFISDGVDKQHYSLLRIQLETGRTHQIRVHMRHIGHPLPGDFLYNPNFSIIKRQALHSACLSFPHPITKTFLHFEAPIPKDMQNIFPSFIGFHESSEPHPYEDILQDTSQLSHDLPHD